MGIAALDNTTDVAAALAILLDHDPANVDREELGKLMRHARRVRGFLDGFDVACTRRGRELAAQGESEDPYTLLIKGGCRSGKEAHNTDVREGLCTELPEFEAALAAGDVSTHHLDALGKLTKNLTDEERLDLKDHVGELLDHATGEWAETFEKNAKSIITQIRDQHRPNSDAEELERQRRDSNVSSWVDKQTGMRKTLVELDPLRHDEWWRAYDAQLARLKAEPGSHDKTYQQLKVEAFLATVQAGPASGEQPVAQQRVPKALVVIDHETILNGRHAATIAELSDGTPLPIATIRQLLCEADIVPVVLGGAGHALDVGRARRLATAAQRDALRAMYPTCVEPGCTVPFDQCELHHAEPFSGTGRTDLDNLLPVCNRGHTKIHTHGWHVRTADSHQTITWTRPDGTIDHHGPAPNRHNRNKPGPPIADPP